MKLKLLLFTTLLTGSVFYAQVGINNTDPKASLDITASSQANPLNTDGLLIPRIDDFPAINPTADQQGILVYLTTFSGGNFPGYYYWENGTSTWKAMLGTSDADFYEAGGTPPNDINDNIYTLGKVKIGLSTFLPSDGTLSVLSNDGKAATFTNTNTTAVGTSIILNADNSTIKTGMEIHLSGTTNGTNYINSGYKFTDNLSGIQQRRGIQQNFIGTNTSTTSNTYGISNNFLNTSNYLGNIYTLSNTISSNGSGRHYGVFNDLDGTGEGQHYGTFNQLSGTGNGNKFGTYNFIDTSTNGTHYGVYSDVQSPTGYAGFFKGRVSFGLTGTSDNYIFPQTRGTNGQVMSTDGNGNLSWTTITIDDSDFFETGGTPPNDINDDIYTLGKVNIGSTDFSTSTTLKINTLENTGIFIQNNNASSPNGLTLSLPADNANIKTGLSVNLSGINSNTFISSGIKNNYTTTGTNNSLRGIIQNFNGNSTNGIVVGLDNSFISSSSYKIIFGVSNLIEADGTGEHTAVTNSLGGIGTGTQKGVENYINNSGNGNHYGNYTILSGTGSGNKYGSYNFIDTSANGTHYGVYSDVLSTTGYAGYFLGRVSIGTTTSNNYILPSTRGSNGQVMRTDGAGNLTWITPTQSDADWFEVGTTSVPNNINDNIFTYGFVGIGDNTPDSKLDVEYTGANSSGTTITYNYTGNINPPAGLRVNSETSGTGSNDRIFGAYIQTQNSNSSSYSTAVYGFSSANATYNIGISGNANGNGTRNVGIIGTAYNASSYNIGGKFAISWPSSASNYGIVASAEGGSITNWAGYFGEYIAPTAGSGNVYIQDLLQVDGALKFTNGANNNYILKTDATGNATWVNPTTIFTDTNTQNTLDQAYDKGGAGAGRIITADNGAVSIEGTDGFQVTGTSGTGATITLSGAGTRMFFNPRKGAFRAGGVSGTQWDNVNVGNYSFVSGLSNIASGENATAMGSYSTASAINATAIGYNTTASGVDATAFGGNTTASNAFSTALGGGTTASGDTATAMGNNTTASGYSSMAMGLNTTASGNNATAMGNNTIASGNSSTALGDNSSASGFRSTTMGYYTVAPSFAETTLGVYPTTYSPSGTSTFVNSDRLFTIGNGADDANRSNALTIYKNGLININDAYNLPLSDGTSNQLLYTDGSGNLAWVNSSLLGTDDQNITGSSLSGTNLTIGIENGSSQIINLSSLQDADWYEAGGTPPNSINDNIYTNGKVGINNSSPGSSLDIVSNSSGSIGQISVTETGAGDGARILFKNAVETTNKWTLYARADNTSTDNYFNIHNSTVGDIIIVKGDGKVGIGTAPSYEFDVEDSQSSNFIARFNNSSTSTNADGIRIRLAASSLSTNNYFIGFYRGIGNNSGKIVGNATGVLYQTTSDRRLKTHIVSVENALEKIEKIQPRKYEYKANLGTKEYGFIAQELQLIYPQAVSGDPEGNVETDPMMVDYARLTPILTAGIKELNQKVKKLEEKNKKQEQELKKLREQLLQYSDLETRLKLLETKVQP